ncbi:mechanosensitive ion channel family protein [Gynurincola endophyticus]|uniref:mechanosensitive ion channel family protein n=1 Tax=Gynurincola endophyticus TaxID=2479004 RepID=UPI000F8C87BB|nr:mechanosensitive ion channel domain-containing protein [Gynurincola endophyticus]
MIEIWNDVFWDNTIGSYISVGITILVIFFLQKLISKYIALFLYRLLKLLFSKLDRDSFVNLLVNPIKTYLVIVASIIAIGSLKFPGVLNFTIYRTDFKSLLHSVSQLVLVYAFIKLILSIIEFVAEILMRRAKLTPSTKDDQLITFFKDFVKAIVIIIGIFLVFKFVFNYPISNLVTAISIVGAALSLAAKESLENIIASFIIFMDDPFEVGDYVRVQNVSGAVERIGLRSTRIRTDQKTLVTVPNKVMVDSIMDNVTVRNQIRGLVILDVPYILPAEQLEALVKSIRDYIVNEESIVINSNVFVTDIVEYKVKIHVEYFTKVIPGGEFNDLKNRINIRLMREVQGIQQRKEG